ncbi:Nn.00g109100.m01.CDS01 [Neocucurbitaria sp. VM-36]
MSTAAANKPPSTGTPRREATSKTSSSSPGAANRTPARSSTPTTNGTSGVTRTRSVRSSANGAPVSARSAAKRPAASSNLSNGASQADATDDEARDEQTAYLQDLKDRLQKAETEAEERQKQVEVLNARLDDALQEQAKLEERAHEEEEKAESLENDKRELTRQHRELEGIYEAERAQAMKEKEETQTREDELQDTIQRLKESMATKHVEGDEEHVSRASSFRHGPSRNNSSQNLDNVASFAPPSSIQRSNSRNNSKLIHQKDKIIEDLRLELAEYQVKVLEVENAGGGRLRELEKQLLETRMTNARLMEDNESFQLLLGEKTLNGDLSRGDFLRESSHTEDRAPSRNGPSTSLADELQSAEEADAEVVRRLEAEVNSMKDQNKALTLYINKIIGRLLTHQGFESVLGNDLEEDQAHSAPDKNKELPPPPPQENEQPQGFLQRAKSVAMGGNRKSRPISMMGPPATNPQSVNEDPTTAPSIPLARSTSNRKPSGSYTHRRSTSEMPQPGAANVINNMYRPSPVSTTPGAVSPGIVSPRNSFFGLPVSGAGNSNPTSRVPSGQIPIHEEREVDAKTETSSSASHVDTPSPPRRLERSETSTGVMTGKGMRPLRLVQNEEEAMKARKAANRASWFGGLFGQAPPSQQNQENAQ